MQRPNIPLFHTMRRLEELLPSMRPPAWSPCLSTVSCSPASRLCLLLRLLCLLGRRCRQEQREGCASPAPARRPRGPGSRVGPAHQPAWPQKGSSQPGGHDVLPRRPGNRPRCACSRWRYLRGGPRDALRVGICLLRGWQDGGFHRPRLPLSRRPAVQGCREDTGHRARAAAGRHRPQLG